MLLVLSLLLAQPVPDPVRAQEAPAPLSPPRLIEPVAAEYPPGRTGAARESAVTGSDGRFELRGLPEGEPVEVVIAAPGYQRFSARETIPRGEKLQVEYRLQPLLVSPYEATIEGERERREISHMLVPKEETDKIPGAQGDSLKVVEDLPGVPPPTPIAAGVLLIRGSNPGDSLVYLDGEPIPLLFHFGAFSRT